MTFFILRYLLSILFPFFYDHNCWFSLFQSWLLHLHTQMTAIAALDHSFRSFHIFYLTSHFFLLPPSLFFLIKELLIMPNKNYILTFWFCYTLPFHALIFLVQFCPPFKFNLLCLSPWHVPSIISFAFLLNSFLSLHSQYKDVLFFSV